jgi:hypothetical protein
MNDQTARVIAYINGGPFPGQITPDTITPRNTPVDVLRVSGFPLLDVGGDWFLKIDEDRAEGGLSVYVWFPWNGKLKGHLVTEYEGLTPDHEVYDTTPVRWAEVAQAWRMQTAEEDYAA